jgi:hypothetical protein
MADRGFQREMTVTHNIEGNEINFISNGYHVFVKTGSLVHDTIVADVNEDFDNLEDLADDWLNKHEKQFLRSDL